MYRLMNVLTLNTAHMYYMANYPLSHLVLEWLKLLLFFCFMFLVHFCITLTMHVSHSENNFLLDFINKDF